ncbi:dihydrofolate reductase family protein [Aeromicrobium sp. CTD01-1L150]|uniref:dihydrofolate reductase family protein n=1 Tax=Aeromicrobium sp. CTD01-1L150 TaxID=3341830 RepID=UPI0035C1B5D3
MDPDLYAYPTSERPWVRTNFVTTIDGSVTDEGGVSGSLGGEVDHQAFTIMRSLADVVLVGAGTTRAEGYGPIDPADLDSSLPAARVPQLAVVTRSLRVPQPLCVPGVMVVTAADEDAPGVTVLREVGVEVLTGDGQKVDWPAVLGTWASRGLRRILCEGGPTLHGELISQDLVDEICLTIAPVLTTGGPAMTRHPTPAQLGFRLGHAVPQDDVLLTRWVRDRPRGAR